MSGGVGAAIAFMAAGCLLAAGAGVAVEVCWAKMGAVARVSARLMMLRARDGNLVGRIAEFTGPEWVGISTSCRQRERDMTKAGKRQRFTGRSICIS